LATLTLAPDWVGVPPHIWVITCPFANDQVNVQPLMAVVPVLVMCTAPWKPPGHWPATE